MRQQHENPQKKADSSCHVYLVNVKDENEQRVSSF